MTPHYINPHENIFTPPPPSPPHTHAHTQTYTHTHLVINEENALETLSHLNPLANVFHPNVLRNQNPSDLALPKHNRDVYFPPFKPISTALNPDAMSFIPKHNALMVYHVILIIIVFILILLILFIKILYGSEN